MLPFIVVSFTSIKLLTEHVSRINKKLSKDLKPYKIQSKKIKTAFFLEGKNTEDEVFMFSLLLNVQGYYSCT